MTKKSLSDLLREEVAQSEAIASAEVEENTQDTVQLSTSQVPRSRMTKAQLDNQVTELTTSLESANEQVNHLQTQVHSLEREIEQHKALVSNLQEELQAASQHQTELAEQKQLVEKLYTQLQQKEEIALQLEEKNQRIESLKTELAQINNASSDLPISEEIMAKSQGLVVPQRSSLYRQTQEELEPYLAPPLSAKQLSNEDIGWFD